MLKKIIGYTKELFTTKKHHINQTPRVITREEHGINPRHVSYEAIKTIRNLQNAGYEAYLVGGAVRDLLLGVTPKDFDVVTNATPEQIKRCQRRAIIIGRRFRLVHVMFGREVIECSTFRALQGEGVKKDSHGRVVSDNVFGEMWEDAARRDFTINALFYDPVTEEVIDYHDGFKDIFAGVVRMIGEPAARYREDPVRMLRAIRIASKLDFEIEPETLAPIRSMSNLLSNVPEARLFDEAMKLLTCGKALKCIEALQSLHLYRNVIPLLDVALKEPHGEEFLMLAMQRTDERIASGKKVSPSFLFATLLWPMTHRIFEEHIARGGQQIPSMIRAGQEVLDRQCERLAIQNRFVEDIMTIWVLQIKLLKRSSTKATFGLLNIPKFRAGYDFMLLRSLLGFVDKEIVDWWTLFQEVDDKTRHEMVAVQAALAQQNRKTRRGEVKKPTKAQVKKRLMEEAKTWQDARDADQWVNTFVEDDIEDEPQPAEAKPARSKSRRSTTNRRTLKPKRETEPSVEDYEVAFADEMSLVEETVTQAPAKEALAVEMPVEKSAAVKDSITEEKPKRAPRRTKAERLEDKSVIAQETTVAEETPKRVRRTRKAMAKPAEVSSEVQEDAVTPVRVRKPRQRSALLTRILAENNVE